jgi:aryl-alcohol dehydrogenase-like predicted oxidoreductase
LTPRGLRILDALDEVAKNHHVKPATIALAWLMSRPGITAPIASATSPGQLDDLTKAVSIRLDQQSIQLLDDASAYEPEMRTVSR